MLTQLVGKILGDRPHTAVACDASGEHGIRRFLLALAELAAVGVAVDASTLFDGRDAQAVDPAAVPARAPYLLDGSRVRTADGERVPGSLPAGARVPADHPGRRAGAGGGRWRPAGARGRVPARHAADRGGRARRRPRRAGRAAVVVRPRGAVARHRRGVGASAGDRVGAAGNGQHGNGVGGNGVGGNGLGTGGAGHGVDAPAPAAGPPVLTPEALLETVVAIVSERTGYPVEMLDPDLDLEAELSIDSIKRIEILGELAERVGLPGMDESGVDESVIEELALIKTLRGIVDWVEDHRDDEALLAAANGSSPAAAAAARRRRPCSAPRRCSRRWWRS